MQKLFFMIVIASVLPCDAAQPKPTASASATAASSAAASSTNPAAIASPFTFAVPAPRPPRIKRDEKSQKEFDKSEKAPASSTTAASSSNKQYFQPNHKIREEQETAHALAMIQAKEQVNKTNNVFEDEIESVAQKNDEQVKEYFKKKILSKYGKVSSEQKQALWHSFKLMISQSRQVAKTKSITASSASSSSTSSSAASSYQSATASAAANNSSNDAKRLQKIAQNYSASFADKK